MRLRWGTRQHIEVTNSSVIVCPDRIFKALRPEDLHRCAPSIFAEHARPGVSSRYSIVSTEQVVALLVADVDDAAGISRRHNFSESQPKPIYVYYTCLNRNDLRIAHCGRRSSQRGQSLLINLNSILPANPIFRYILHLPMIRS